MEHLLAELKRNESTSTTRTYIQCVAGISRQAGHRIGRMSSLKWLWETCMHFRTAPFSGNTSVLTLVLTHQWLVLCGSLCAPDLALISAGRLWLRFCSDFKVLQHFLGLN